MPLPGDVTPEVAELLPTTVFYRDGTPLRMFSLLAHHAPAFMAVLQFGRALNAGSNLSPREKELVILRSASLTQCGYEVSVHEKVARERLGFTEAEVAALDQPRHRALDHFEGRERALLLLVEELCCTDSLSQRSWREVSEVLDTPTIVEILCLTGYYRTIAGLANAVVLPAEKLEL
jgi:AhpD family alkylhydroperoxidase